MKFFDQERKNIRFLDEEGPKVILVGGDKKTSELIAEANLDFVNKSITDENFPLPPGRRLSSDHFEFRPFKGCRKFQDVIEAVRKMPEFRLPTFEHALQFAKQLQSVQRYGHLVFLQEKPQILPGNGPAVIVLYGSDVNRTMGLDFLNYGIERKSQFALIKNYSEKVSYFEPDLVGHA